MTEEQAVREEAALAEQEQKLQEIFEYEREETRRKFEDELATLRDKQEKELKNIQDRYLDYVQVCFLYELEF